MTSDAGPFPTCEEWTSRLNCFRIRRDISASALPQVPRFRGAQPSDGAPRQRADVEGKHSVLGPTHSVLHPSDGIPASRCNLRVEAAQDARQ